MQLLKNLVKEYTVECCCLDFLCAENLAEVSYFDHIIVFI